MIDDCVWSYWNEGFSIIPIKARSKKPNIKSWEKYQAVQPTQDEITDWLNKNLFKNIGIICGAVSNNLVIIDIDDEMGLDLNLINPEQIDGIIVTNLFGHVCNVSKYIDWCKTHNKILLFDNATVTQTEFNNINALNFGEGSIVSLHHTKPLGYGEGGLIITNKKYEDDIRKCINFGFSLEKGILKWNRYGSNCKMSEISAAFILDYLKDFDKIIDSHTNLYDFFLKEITNIKGIYAFPNFSSNTPFVNCIPVFF